MAILNKNKKKSEEEFGGQWPVPGYYHVAISNCEQTADKNSKPLVAVEFQVIADGIGLDKKSHTNGQAGKTASTNLYLMSDKGEKETESCLEQVARFALVAGLIPPGEAVDTDDIQWQDAIGREVVIQVEEKSKDETDANGKKTRVKTGYSQVTWMGFWSLGNPAMKDVPRDLKSPGMQALGRGQVSGGKAPPVASDGHTGGKTPASTNGNGNGTAANGNGSTPGTPGTTASGAMTSNKYADL